MDIKRIEEVANDIRINERDIKNAILEIDALDEEYWEDDGYGDTTENCMKVKEALWLASHVLKNGAIQRGMWIDITNKKGSVIACRCSNCEQSPKHNIRSDYCPNCGAIMNLTEDFIKHFGEAV